MTINPPSLNLDMSLIHQWIGERRFIWQMDFLTTKKFMDYAKARGMDFGWTDEDIKKFRKLWKLGLIRADIIMSEFDLNEEGLVFLSKNEFSQYLYTDARNLAVKEGGYLDSLSEVDDVSPQIELLFHPFRLFALHKIKTVAEINIHPLVIYSSSTAFNDIIKFRIDSFNSFSSDGNFWNKISYWNEIVTLAVITEPFTFNQLFGFYHIHSAFPPLLKDEENRENFFTSMNVHVNDVKELLRDADVNVAKEMIAELCREAELIEPNADVLRLLRLTKGTFRLEKLKGNLGLAMNLLSIAETIRRSFEMAFDLKLEEEDQSGFGWDRGSFKEFYYGSKRLLENSNAKVEFIRSLGLDYNIRLRWYVEGETEFYALQSEFEGNIAIEIVNLKGEIVAGKGKGLAFSENLSNDISRSVYSWVSLDKDISENCRVVKKAAERDAMFGSYFFANPDFEFENFTLSELVELVWEMALDRGVNPNEKTKLIESTKSTTKGSEFESAVARSIQELNSFSKGKDWGEKLMRFAKANREIQMKDGSSKVRQICESIILAHYAIPCNYNLSRQECKIDLETGRLINLK